MSDPVTTTTDAAGTAPRGGTALDAAVRVRQGAFTLDLHIAAGAGETVAVMGPSGAGKSTLFHALAGSVPLAGGHVALNGRVVDDGAGRRVPTPARGIVLLGQRARLFPHLSARENVAFGPRARRVPARRARADAEAWLARVGLAGMADRRPAALSGGQQQRVALARALATSPAVLLLDEPFTGLDPATAAEIRALLHAEIVATGVTVLIATHDVVDAASLARRLVIVEDGRITQEGLVRDVLRTPATGFAATIAGVQRLVGAAAGGVWRSADGQLALAGRGAASVADGTALAALVHPGDVTVLPAPAAGDPVPVGQDAGRGHPARVVRLEQTPAGVRVHTDAAGLCADVPADAVAAAGLAPGIPVRVHVAPDRVRLVAV